MRIKKTISAPVKEGFVFIFYIYDELFFKEENENISIKLGSFVLNFFFLTVGSSFKLLLWRFFYFIVINSFMNYFLLFRVFFDK